VIAHFPPYALRPSAFRFPALAALVGRASRGGQREATLACLVTARVCAGLLPPYEIALENLSYRADQARQWLGSIAIPASLRNLFAKVIEMAGSANGAGAGRALETLLSSELLSLDEGSRTELTRLVTELTTVNV
jgi:hypothetical protein